MDLKTCLIIILTTITLTFGDTFHWDDKNGQISPGCTSPMVLKEPQNLIPQIANKDFKAKMMKFPKKIGYNLMSRSRWTSYCYDGGFIDPNTGCSSSWKGISPTIQEAREWKSRNQCQIGHICRIDGDCWGSDSNKCKDETISKWVDHSEHQGIGQRYLLFPHHTCISSWECSNSMIDFPIHVSGSIENPLVYIPLPNGTSLLINGEESLQNLDKEGSQVLYVHEDVKRDLYDEEINCFVREESIKCITKDSRNMDGGIALDLDDKLCGTLGSAIVCIRDEESILRMEKAGFTMAPKKKPNTGEANTFKTVSIESLNEAIEEILVVQNQAEYNTVEIAISVNKLQKISLEIIRSLGKIDDKLIGNLIQKKEATTKWINHDIFKECWGEEKEMPSYSNCIGNSIFNKGRYRAKGNGDLCFSIKQEDMVNISIFEDQSLNFDMLRKPEIMESYIDQEGWSWMSKNVMKIQEMQSEGSRSSVYSAVQGAVAELNPFGGIWKIVIGLTTPVAWISLILIIMERRRG